MLLFFFFFFSSRRRQTRLTCDWSSDVCSSDLLIVPSVAAMMYARHIGPRLAIGWTMGTIVSALGVWLSLILDLPTGATIVCTFGIVLAIMAAVRPVLVRGHARSP